MPHGMCYLWEPGILWTHVISDVTIAGAYYSIPACLFIFVKKRGDIEFRGIMVMFALFILACGTTHLVGAWVTWNPTYRLQGALKATTALISIVTAAALWPLLPKALALPSPSQLREANAELANEAQERRRAEETLQALNISLETRVAERTSELARANEELEAFAHVVSHDLKAPLRAIANLAEWVEQDHLEQMDEQGRGYVESIGSRARTLKDRIDAILEYSLLGGVDFPDRTVDATPIARQVVEGIALRAGVQVVIRDPLPLIRIRQAKLVQILQNLIVNADRHMGPEGTRIEVSGGSDSQEAWLSVSDDGQGIDPMHHENVFNLFHSLSGAPPGSTGAGLAIVQRIARAAGGRVEVESERGAGATFTVYFPLEAPPTPS